MLEFVTEFWMLDIGLGNTLAPAIAMDPPAAARRSYALGCFATGTPVLDGFEGGFIVFGCGGGEVEGGKRVGLTSGRGRAQSIRRCSANIEL